MNLNRLLFLRKQLMAPLDAGPRIPPPPPSLLLVWNTRVWPDSGGRPLCCQMPTVKLQTVPPSLHGGLFTRNGPEPTLSTPFGGAGTRIRLQATIRPNLLWRRLCLCVSSNSNRKAAKIIHLNLLLSALLCCPVSTGLSSVCGVDSYCSGILLRNAIRSRGWGSCVFVRLRQCNQI